MKAGPAPAGDPHPSQTPDQVTHTRADPGANAPPSNATVTDTTSTGGSASEGGGRWAAAILLITHVVEVAAMVTVVLSFALPTAEAPSTPDNDKNINILIKPRLTLQIVLTTAPLVLITAISLVWAVRAQDFSGRATARMLCWLLHILQASILWRFLKVHLAFDSSDVAELGTLRFVQVHVHTLPFLVMHMAIILGEPAAPGVLLVLAAAILVISAVVAVVVATTASHSSRPSSLTPPTITQVAHYPIHGRQQGSEHTHNHDYAARVVVAVTTACVIWSRAVAVAALFCLTITWTSILIAIHWAAALVWLCLQDELEPTTLGPVRRLLRRVFLAYLLLWDWHVFRDDASAMTVCARPRLPAAYYSVTAIQNVAVTATWYTASKVALPVVRTAILSSVLAAQAVALLLLALSYLYCSSLLPSWPRNKAGAVARTASLVTPSAKTAPVTPHADSLEHDNSSYVDFKDAEDNVVPEANKDKVDVENGKDAVSTPLKIHPPVAQSTPMPLAPRLMTANLPPAIFSFSHDILPPRLTKSERSSTDNGSFNSRNTNTLPNQLPPEYDLLHRAHGSFSDSFSSLSCGTVNRGTTVARTLVVHDARSQRTPPLVSKASFASHSSCRNGYCHCKLFDGFEGPCDVEEEDEEEEEKETDQQDRHGEKKCVDKLKNGHIIKCSNPLSRPGIISKSDVLHDPSETEPVVCDSAPQVAVVRGIQRFRVVCAACLHAHDPLLTRCHVHTPLTEPPISSWCQTATLMRCHTASAALSQSCGGLGGGSSTDYPSDTEVTATADTLSSASADSHSTYTTWPVGRGPGMARLLQLHPGSHDYVTAWLRHQQARGPRVPPPPSQQMSSESYSSAIPEVPVRRQRRPRRHLPRPLRHKDPPPPHLLQDLETVV